MTDKLGLVDSVGLKVGSLDGFALAEGNELSKDDDVGTPDG